MVAANAMISRRISFLLLLMPLMFAADRLYSAGSPRSVPNFNLVDLRGKNHELRRTEAKAVVLFFTGNGCPIARKSVDKIKFLHDQFGTNVVFWLVNTYSQDSLGDCEKEYRDFHMWPLTYLRDPHQALALALDVQRTAEVVAISSDNWRIFYRGSIDDQLSEGAQKPDAEHKFLEAALGEFIAGKEITTPRTEPHGCRIAFEVDDPSDDATFYSKKVAPLLSAHCVQCHREGGIGPWAMDSCARVKDYSRMIQEVLLTQRMPPWHADPAFGHWANDRSLTGEQTQILLRWIASGAPQGSSGDPLTEPLPPLADWPLGSPSFTVKLPKPENIPANGVLDYRHITVDLPITNDVWLCGLDVKPGNRLVVHHVIVRAKWPEGPDDGSGYGINLSGWAPGMVNARFESGTGKLLPANAKLDLEMHYTTVGSPQTDQTQVAFYLLPEKPEREVSTRSALQTDLDIPPGTDESRDSAVYGFKKPATIYSLMPHMHLRGKWMRFELLSPSGHRETLLNVPRYDFNWQTVYRFDKPRHVPAGSWLLVTGGFDNSAQNPSNPASHKRVQFGLQSWDEMFIGFFDAADDATPLPALSQKTSTGPEKTAIR